MNTEQITPEEKILREIDDAISKEKESTITIKDEQLALSSEEQLRVSRISTLLRTVGIGVLLVGVSCFLLQRWGVVDHFQRYLLFLCFTGSVCAAGLWCGLGIKENKGARTLLGTVVALIPVHCAQLGAMVYSQVGSGFENHPTFLRWDAGDMTHAFLATGIGLAVLLPLSYLSYSVLARRYATSLCAIGFGVSSLLLVPTRSPLFSALLIITGAAATAFAERRFIRISELKTREAFIARSIPLIALAMLVGRQYLYDYSTFIMGTLFGFAAIGLLALARALASYRWAVATLELTSLSCATLAGLFCGHAIVGSLELYGTIASPLLIGIPTSIGLFVLGMFAIGSSRAFNGVGSVAIFLTGIAELSHYDPSGKVVALVCGIAALWSACLTHQRPLLIGGSTLTALSLMLIIKSIAQGFSPTLWWITLSITGVATVISASYFERYFSQLQEATIAARSRIGEWR
jgi:hypothetical protein